MLFAEHLFENRCGTLEQTLGGAELTSIPGEVTHQAQNAREANVVFTVQRPHRDERAIVQRRSLAQPALVRDGSTEHQKMARRPRMRRSVPVLMDLQRLREQTLRFGVVAMIQLNVAQVEQIHGNARVMLAEERVIYRQRSVVDCFGGIHMAKVILSIRQISQRF
jgi:hypothetical protein